MSKLKIKNANGVWESVAPSQKEFDNVKTQLADMADEKPSIIQQILFGNKTKWIAHRGATTISPGNTIPAYELAGKLKYWGCETDAQVTKDGVWVTIHDTTVDSMTNGTGAVNSLTYAQIQELKVDSGNNISMYPNLKVPTFEEYLFICKQYDMIPCVEMKAVGLTAQNYDDFVAILKKYNMLDKVLVSSFETTNLRALRERSSSVALEYLCNSMTNAEIAVAESLKGCGISPNHATITKELVEIAHSKGIHVNCWTIFNTTTALVAINKGVDVIITESLGGVI